MEVPHTADEKQDVRRDNDHCDTVELVDDGPAAPFFETVTAHDQTRRSRSEAIIVLQLLHVVQCLLIVAPIL